MRASRIFTVFRSDKPPRNLYERDSRFAQRPPPGENEAGSGSAAHGSSRSRCQKAADQLQDPETGFAEIWAATTSGDTELPRPRSRLVAHLQLPICRHSPSGEFITTELHTARLLMSNRIFAITERVFGGYLLHSGASSGLRCFPTSFRDGQRGRAAPRAQTSCSRILRKGVSARES